MKNMGVIFIALLWTHSAFAQPGAIDDNVVTVAYKGMVNGLKIEAIWKPNEARNEHVLGPAIIELTNVEHGTSSTVVTNHFSIKLERLEGFIAKVPTEDGNGHALKILDKKISLEYTNPKIAEEEHDFGTDEEPFFFYDINFDGRDDFIVVEMYNAQRHRHAYKAYELDDNQKIWVLENDYLQITNKEPYRFLDSLTTVDKEKKTITIHFSGGALYSYQDIYTITPDGYTKEALNK